MPLPYVILEPGEPWVRREFVHEKGSKGDAAKHRLARKWTGGEGGSASTCACDGWGHSPPLPPSSCFFISQCTSLSSLPLPSPILRPPPIFLAPPSSFIWNFSLIPDLPSPFSPLPPLFCSYPLSTCFSHILRPHLLIPLPFFAYLLPPSPTSRSKRC